MVLKFNAEAVIRKKSLKKSFLRAENENKFENHQLRVTLVL